MFNNSSVCVRITITVINRIEDCMLTNHNIIIGKIPK